MTPTWDEINWKTPQQIDALKMNGVIDRKIAENQLVMKRDKLPGGEKIGAEYPSTDEMV